MPEAAPVCLLLRLASSETRTVVDPTCTRQRLGRISFRAIKEKRDYMGKRKSASWMYMSRLAAHKEWAFLNVGGVSL